MERRAQVRDQVMGCEPGHHCADGWDANPKPVFPLMSCLSPPMGFDKFINKINLLSIIRGGSAHAGGNRDPAIASGLRAFGPLAGELSTPHLLPAIYVTHFKLREAEHMMGWIAARSPQCRAGMPGQNQQSEF